ncbi:unnamed protein product [Vitrella brassicaformis CCMP3155]|uniref:Uncharacterized protein n=2 Tax=Vitrella brassicaformis TaxID=1169539 RepID=A0A0G4FUP7_VITBC|nr:unnamed protein product [Vitrella brassicaformis CCMP3155]|eukprot:CEM18674.1 unnamed protein product [Vitrella brassicaformis CCMP3155]
MKAANDTTLKQISAHQHRAPTKKDTAFNFGKAPAKGSKKRLDSSLGFLKELSTTLKPIQRPANEPGELALPPQAASDGICCHPDPSDVVERPLGGDVYPLHDNERFLFHLRRDLNVLLEEPGMPARLEAIGRIHRALLLERQQIQTSVYEGLADVVRRALLRGFSDKSEKIRELAIQTFTAVLEGCEDIEPSLAHIYPVLIARLGSEDIDGMAHLPEVLRPVKEQKPQQVRPIEESEEVRLELFNFMQVVIARSTQDEVLQYLDEITGLLRSGAMDPFDGVKLKACELMRVFCYQYHPILLHFAEPMGRSLTSCLVHQHGRVRMAALDTLTAVLFCGAWKYNNEIFEVLIGHQDENVVPVKAFYEAYTTMNYFAKLVDDRSSVVRRHFYETLIYWLHKLPDRVDHEPRIFPYAMSGLFDENDTIQLCMYHMLEKCGELYEVEKKADLREMRQLGFHPPWTYDDRVSLPFPLGARLRLPGSTDSPPTPTTTPSPLPSHSPIQELLGEGWEPPATTPRRPRLGSRCWVKTHFRRIAKALFKEVLDFREATAMRSAQLLCVCLPYIEESVTEYMDGLFSLCVKLFSPSRKTSAEVLQVYHTILLLAGAYVDPLSYWQIAKGALGLDCVYDFERRVASLQVLARLMQGSATALASVGDPGLKCGRLSPILGELCQLLRHSDLLDDTLIEGPAAFGGTDNDPPVVAAVWELLEAAGHPALVAHLHTEWRDELLMCAFAATPDALPMMGESDAQTDNKATDSRSRRTQRLQRYVASLSPAAAPLSLPLPSLLSFAHTHFPALRSLLSVAPITSITQCEQAILDNLQSFTSPAHLSNRRAQARDAAIALVRRLVCEGEAGRGRDVLDGVVLPLLRPLDDESAGPTSWEGWAQLAVSSLGKIRELIAWWPDTSTQDALRDSRLLEDLTGLVAYHWLHLRLFQARVAEYLTQQGSAGQAPGGLTAIDALPISRRRQMRIDAAKHAEKIRLEAAVTLFLAVRRLSSSGGSINWGASLVTMMLDVFLTPQQIDKRAHNKNPRTKEQTAATAAASDAPTSTSAVSGTQEVSSLTLPAIATPPSVAMFVAVAMRRLLVPSWPSDADLAVFDEWYPLSGLKDNAMHAVATLRGGRVRTPVVTMQLDVQSRVVDQLMQYLLDLNVNLSTYTSTSSPHVSSSVLPTSSPMFAFSALARDTKGATGVFQLALTAADKTIQTLLRDETPASGEKEDRRRRASSPAPSSAAAPSPLNLKETINNNAALSVYALLLDCASCFRDAFVSCVDGWRAGGHLVRVDMGRDMLSRCER